jgi:tRNA pseudouridine55 synthase
LAREGKEIERLPRKVTIADIRILSVQLPVVTMEVDCSKGTYIRTLCYDIGRKLGCGGCMNALTRTRVGDFKIQQSLHLAEVEQLRDSQQLEQYIISTEQFFSDYPQLASMEKFDYLLYNGNPLTWHQIDIKEEEKGNMDLLRPVRMYDSHHTFIGIFEYRQEKEYWKPKKMFFVHS